MGRSIEWHDGVKPPKVAEPKAYDSEEDAGEFQRWLQSLLRWFRVNRYCGPEYNEDRVVCAPLFLQGSALTWYNNNVDVLDRPQKVWSFKTLITGLYHRYIHNVVLRTAAEKFRTAEYDPEEGIMAFYHRLT